MPRFLHLADLHLGRIFHGESLVEDQAFLLKQLTALVVKDPPDAVLLAGDIYDRALPPVEAIRLLDDFLSSLSDAGTTVVIIPGNHDSAGRLDYAAGAWEKLGVHIRADYRRLGEPVSITTPDGSVLDIFALPYVEPSILREELKVDSAADEPTRHRNELIETAMEKIRDSRTPGHFSVLLAHEFVAGSTESGSERIYVGGSQSVPSELFKGFDYVALGHIHGNQNVGDESIRYAGSPMSYAFDEAGRPKGYLDITLDSSELYPVIRFQDLEPMRPLVVLEDSLDELLRNQKYESARNSYVSARINDGLSHLNLIGRLRERFPYLRELRQMSLEAVDSTTSSSDAAAESTENVISDFLDRAGWDAGDERDIAMTLLDEVMGSMGEDV